MLRRGKCKRLGAWMLAMIAGFGCDDGGEEVRYASVQLDLTTCLGPPEAAGAGETEICRDQLERRIADQDVNACLLARREDNTVAYLPLQWAEGRLGAAPGRDPSVQIPPGATIDVELYLYGEGYDSGRCAEGSAAAFGAPCDAGSLCLLKLRQLGVQIVDGQTQISFSDEAQGCDVSGATLAAAEICDGVDNDCDGAADEAFPEAGQRCAEGSGVCAAEGELRCVEGALRCDATPLTPAAAEEQDPTQCNGVDDDCDGLVDEGIPDCCALDAVEPCGDLDVGACTLGMRACVEDEAGVRRWGACEGLVTPSEDICDGLDNDCDGVTDEDYLDDPERPLGGACEAGVGACRRVGAYECFEGGVRCSVTAGAEFGELCGDNMDNDCDGLIDEGFVEILGDPCAVGVGQCRREGQIVCGALDRSITECSATEGSASVERCDSLDNDCDGATDEDYAQLGDVCVEGQGACQTAGQLICNPDGPAIDPDTGALTPYLCDAEAPGSPGAQEVACDGADDDCDGQIDEDFDLQSDVDHCGACNRRCVIDGATPTCDAGACVIESCTPGFVDLNGDVEDGCECDQGAEDRPDLAFADTNCDGVDGDASDGIFVSSLDGSDERDGAIDAPVLTLRRAVELAVQSGRRSIFLDVGQHSVGGLSQVIPSGVNIYGGYVYNRQVGEQARWTRSDRRANPAQITRISGAQVVLRYDGVEAPTVLSNLAVESNNIAAFDARPSVAIHAVDVGVDLLELRNVELLAGRGGNGRDGDLAGAGTNTARAGAPGADFDFAACSGCGQIGGGQEENASCADFFYQGGDGGDGENARNDQSAEADDGDAGRGGAIGGPGGVAPDSPGEPGEDGANGVNSAPSVATGQMFADNREGGARLVWLSLPSNDGGQGVPGGGGGGGAGGRGNGGGGIGGGGGGGGGGGCPGLGGRGARGGGGSFALMIVGGRIVLNGATLQSGSAGQGGDGGAGGLGAAGAPGGGGGRGCGQGCTDGGAGGPGGRGGCGGHGGGGAGGPSFAIFRVSTVPGDGESLADSAVIVRDDFGLNSSFAHPEIPAPGGLGGRRAEGDSCGGPAGDGGAGFLGQIGCCVRDASNRCVATLECP